MDSLWKYRSKIDLVESLISTAQCLFRIERKVWNIFGFFLKVGNHIDVLTGKWTALDSGIGAGVDSYFEYLVKGAVLFQYPHFIEQFRGKQVVSFVKSVPNLTATCTVRVVVINFVNLIFFSIRSCNR